MLSLLIICMISVTFTHAYERCEVSLVSQIVSREQWGARSPKSTALMNMPVPHIFIHHTETPSCTSLDSCSRRMRSIQNYHMDNRGWDDIGYNFLIGGDSRVYVGRGWNLKGAHTYGFNHNAIAFSLIGNYSSNLPTENMLGLTKNMIECARNLTYVTDNFKIHGHRDGTCTECPGQALYDHIKTWPRFQGGPLTGYRCRRN